MIHFLSIINYYRLYYISEQFSSDLIISKHFCTFITIFKLNIQQIKQNSFKCKPVIHLSNFFTNTYLRRDQAPAL